MFRSIQSKLITVYLLLILVAMQLSMIYLLKELERGYVRQEQETLSQSAQLLVGQLSNYFVQDENRSAKLDEQAVAKFMSRWRGDVLVLDSNARVIGATMEQPEHKDLIGKKVTHDDITPALVGQIVRRPGVENGEQMAFEADPITKDGIVVGVVYLKASLKYAYDRLGEVRKVLLTAWAIALVATVTMGVALARTITGPIREVTRKAAEMAGGNFDQTIAVRSNDEIGRLGEMFNRMTRRLKQTLEEIRGEKNKVEAILAHMADGLMALDSSGRVIKLNPAGERMLQTVEGEVLGRLPQEIWPETGMDAVLDRALAESRSQTAEIHFGNLILLAYVTPLFADRNQTAGTVVVFHDITELEKLEKMRREFVANVSHELKTPLTTVKSYVETLLDGAAEEPSVRARFLHVVESETDRMTRLVKDLLHLSQLDQGSGNWEVQPYDLSTVADDCLSRLGVQVERKNLTVHRSYARNTPPAMVERDKAQQVLVNLLANAIEFTPTGGEITLDIRPDGAMVRVTVKDTGIGIPREDLPRIFERFYRVDKARSRMLGGTGLGLAIARQIVELLGGAISIDSQVGKGTEVVFTVPAAPPGEAL